MPGTAAAGAATAGAATAGAATAALVPGAALGLDDAEAELDWVVCMTLPRSNALVVGESHVKI